MPCILMMKLSSKEGIGGYVKSSISLKMHVFLPSFLLCPFFFFIYLCIYIFFCYLSRNTVTQSGYIYSARFVFPRLQHHRSADYNLRPVSSSSPCTSCVCVCYFIVKQYIKRAEQSLFFPTSFFFVCSTLDLIPLHFSPFFFFCFVIYFYFYFFSSPRPILQRHILALDCTSLIRSSGILDVSVLKYLAYILVVCCSRQAVESYHLRIYTHTHTFYQKLLFLFPFSPLARKRKRGKVCRCRSNSKGKK